MKMFSKLQSLGIPFIMGIGIGLVVLTNLFISFVGIRFDFSKGQAYTLSPGSKKILHELKNPVTIKFYASANLPSRLIPLKTEVANFLNEYQKENKGKIILKTVDPKNDTTAAGEVREMGIPELKFSQLEQNNYQLSAAYFGLGIFYQNSKQAISQVTDITNLEYNITSFIYKLTNTKRVQIATIGLDQSPIPQQQNPYAVFNSLISQQYDLLPLDLTTDEKKEINPSNVIVFITDANKKKFTENEIAKIKNYIEQKGKVIFLVDGVWTNDNLTTASSESNLSSLLQNYGVTVNKNYVLSSSAEYVNFGNNIYSFLTPYPFWIKTNNFDTTSGYFSNVSSLTFPWTSSVSVAKRDGQKTQILVSSPPSSWEQKDNFELNPDKIKGPASKKDVKSFSLIAEVKTKSQGQIIVIPSSRFLVTQYLSQNSGNIDFVFNLVNNLASGGALSGIRSRSINFYPVPNMPDNMKDVVKYTDILLLPVLFGIYGAIRLLRRK